MKYECARCGCELKYTDYGSRILIEPCENCLDEEYEYGLECGTVATKRYIYEE